MASHPRREALPEVPPRRAVVIDGANVIATSKRFPLERLDLATAWAAACWPSLPVTVFLDHSTAVRCRPEVQRVLRVRCADVSPDRPRYVVCPAQEPADEHLLRHAQEHAGVVLSNDRYADFDALRQGIVLVQFALVGERFEAQDPAVWFRPPHGAQWVELAALRACNGSA
jgi:hypothetical protein